MQEAVSKQKIEKGRKPEGRQLKAASESGRQAGRQAGMQVRTGKEVKRKEGRKEC